MPYEYIEYHHAGTTLEGYLAYTEPSVGPLPLVLVAHAWRGRDEFACHQAEALAQLGYIGFAIDLYGKGVLGHSIEENSRLMQPFMDNRHLLRERLLVALEIAKEHPLVDNQRIAAIGFCFGGLCVLDLARSGANIQGVVSFHGLLTPAPSHVPNASIQAKILALHGYADPMAPPEQVCAFAEEMEQAQVDWQVHLYGHTQHAFTNPSANDPTLGTVYQPVAAQRAWRAMEDFLTELFKQE